MKKFGKVKIASMKPLEDIPDDCGYEKKFKYDINMQNINHQNIIGNTM